MDGVGKKVVEMSKCKKTRAIGGHEIMCGRKTRWSLTDIDCLDSRRHVPVQTANLQSYSNLPPFTPPLQCGSPLFQGKAKDSMLELGAVDGPSESPSGWLLDRKQLADTLLDLLLERGSILFRWV